MDRIIISGDGNEPYPAFTVYEAENATLSGAAATSAVFCGNCSGLAAVGNLGGGNSTVTFNNVVVPPPGTYQMEIDYMIQGQRSFFHLGEREYCAGSRPERLQFRHAHQHSYSGAAECGIQPD